MPRRIRVPYLSKAEIEKEAAGFLNRYNRSRKLPVPIEEIAELDLKLDIVPVARLRDKMDKDAFISNDLATIYIDADVFNLDKLERRLRFSLAHEIGHMVLHARILSAVSLKSIREWRTFVDRLAEDAWHRFEWQANWFAGHVLVPSDELRQLAKKGLKSILPRVQEARRLGLSRNDYLDWTVDQWARKLAPRFHVSTAVLRKRLEADGLADLIP